MTVSSASLREARDTLSWMGNCFNRVDRLSAESAVTVTVIHFHGNGLDRNQPVLAARHTRCDGLAGLLTMVNASLA
ncbi:MAG: hypothetical protein ABW110_21085, partial [Steroidobacteraceae bacterium]